MKTTLKTVALATAPLAAALLLTPGLALAQSGAAAGAVAHVDAAGLQIETAMAQAGRGGVGHDAFLAASSRRVLRRKRP